MMFNDQNLLDEFINSFGLPRDGYSEPTKFSDSFGFSTVKEHIVREGRRYLSLYKFRIAYEEFDKNTDIKPVTAIVYYGWRDAEGKIVISSSEVDKKIFWPLDLISENEFFYDVKNKSFLKNGIVLSPRDVLSFLEKQHHKVTSKSALLLRFKLVIARKFTPCIFELLHVVLVGSLNLLSGIKTKKSLALIAYKENETIFETPQDSIDYNSFDGQKINLMGYSASARSVFLYCLIHLAIFASLYFKAHWVLHNGLMQTIFKNNFLTIAYVIPSLILLDRSIPFLLKKAIIISSRGYQRVLMWKVRV